MAINNFEIEPPQLRTSNWVTQAFPRFSAKSFTFGVSAIQIVYYLVSVVIDGGFINPTYCALFTLGANVSSQVVHAECY